MMAALKGKTPQPTSTRYVKMMMFGPAGVGKTTAAIQMPKPYIIDTEGGTRHYGEEIQAAGGAVLESNDVDEITEEIRTLSSTEHSYHTVVIDPFTTLWSALLDEGAQKVGDDMRMFSYATTRAKRLFSILDLIPMHVMVTTHAKNRYSKDGKFNVLGETFDGWNKLDYRFDLVLHLDRKGKRRNAKVTKTRIREFEDGELFEWSADTLNTRLPTLSEKPGKIEYADAADIERMLDLLKHRADGDDVLRKVLQSAKVADAHELGPERVGKAIRWLTGEHDS